MVLPPGISFFAKNREYQIVCANRHFVESLGFRSEDELTGKGDFDLFPARLAESFWLAAAWVWPLCSISEPR